MPNFSIVGKVSLCRTVIYRNTRTEVVGVLEQLTGAGTDAAWRGHGFPGHPSELASRTCSLLIKDMSTVPLISPAEMSGQALSVVFF